MKDHYVETNEESNNPKYAWMFIVVFAVVLLSALFWSLSNDGADVLIIDDSPNVVVDDAVTVTTTDNFRTQATIAANQDFYTKPVDGSFITAEPVTVRQVVSDRLFTISASATGPEIYAYLDQALGNGALEQIIDVNPGDKLLLDGVIVMDFDNYPYTTEERTALISSQAKVLVDEIAFVN